MNSLRAMNSLPLIHSPSVNVIRLSRWTLVVARSLWLAVCVTATPTSLFALSYHWMILVKTNPARLTIIG